MKKITYKGKQLDNYLMDANGDIWTTNKSYYKKMRTHTNNNCRDKRPKITLRINKKKHTIKIHRMVCETYHPVPIPTGVTEFEWNLTPQSVKACFTDFWEVNHIDHTHGNYHPKNLEWTSRTENTKKYHEYRILNSDKKES